MKILFRLKYNKKDLQPVLRPVEQVPLLKGLWWVESTFGAKAEQIDRQANILYKSQI